MDLARKIALLVVFIIPTFVLSGLIWDWTESWWAVLALVVIMVVVYAMIVTGKFRGDSRTA